MKINRIHLTSFGHFTGQTVDLDHPAGGLRIVVGPNEAGKSTLLDAIRVALFGTTGTRTAGQPTSTMRLSFEFEHDGVSGTVARAGRGAPTSDASSNFDENSLAAMVHVDRELFERLFTIDHDELRRYGEPLLQANGRIGELIFGAALGGQRVKEVSDDLAAEVDKLFKPRGKSKLVDALDAVVAARAERDRVLVTADSWADTKADIDRLSAKISDIDDDLGRLRAETSKLQRITTVRPLLVRRDSLVGDEATLRAAGPVPPESEWGNLAEVLEQLSESSRIAAELQGRIDSLQAAREALPQDRRALAAGGDIVALYEQVAVYRTAAADVARLTPVVAGANALANADALRSTLADTAPLGDTAGQLPQRSGELAGLEAEGTATARRLGLDPGDLDLLLQLAVPDPASIETARVQAADLANREKSASKAVKTAMATVKAARSGVRGLEDGDPVATAERIASVRSERDSTVKRVRKRLLKGAKAGEPTNDELANALETSIADADVAADSVINDTERAAQLLAARAELARASEALKDAERDVELLVAERQTFQTSWNESWQGAGISPDSPEEMATWRSSWVGLSELVADLRSSQATFAQDQEVVAAAAARLRSALTDAGAKPPKDAELPGLLEVAQRLVKEHDALEADRAKLAEATAKVNGLDEAVAPLLALLGSGSTARGDRAITDLEALRQEQQQHDAEVRRLDGEIRQLQEEVSGHTASSQQAAQELEQLSEKCHIPFDELSTASERAADLAAVRAALQQIDTDLVDSGGLKIEDLLVEAAAVGGPDEVAARILHIAALEQGQSDERDRLVEQRRTLQIEFDKATGGSDAAVAQQDVEEALTALGDVVERYTRIALAKAVLDRVVEGAGGADRGDLVEQAGRLFAHLTDGEFVGIGMEPHGTRTVATAVRSAESGGLPVFVPALSDGTQDQLWLSLRLAGVFQHVGQVGAVPVVVDDLLVNFDDQRAALAIDTLAELAQHTQVVVITHHPHLVEIARARLGDERLRVSELGPRPKHAPVMAQVVAAEEDVSPTPLPELDAPKAPTANGAPSSGASAEVNALLEALRAGPGKRSDLIERSGIDEGMWLVASRRLLETGLVELDGRTYRMKAEQGSDELEAEDNE